MKFFNSEEIGKTAAIFIGENYLAGSRPIVLQAQSAVVKAGTPITAAGAVALDGANAYGILINDVDTSIDPNGAIAVTDCMVDYNKAKANAGITATLATLAAALPLIKFIDDTVVSTAMTASAYSTNVTKGGTATITISGAVGTVTVTTGNSAVATGSLSGTTLTISGVESGNCVVKAVDAIGNMVNILVTVYDVKVDKATMTLAVGATGTISVSGGLEPYTVASSTEAKATAAIAGSVVTVTGVASGTATITVTDALGDTATCAVTVS